MKSLAASRLGCSILALFAAGAVSCGPPGPGNFEGSWRGTRTISPGGTSETSIGITGTEMTMADMLVDVGTLGNDQHCVLAFTREGDTATIRDGQTCVGSAFGPFLATVTTGTANTSETGSTRSVTVILSGTYTPTIGSTGPFTLTFTGSRQ